MGFSKIRKVARNWARCARDRNYRFIYLARHGVYNHMSDRAFLEEYYKRKFGRPLNLDDPKSFNEKLQWLKLYDRRPEYTMMVDKYAVKSYVAGKIGEEHIIPTLGVWDHFDEIDFDSLPDQFVLKCTHDSGGIVIVKDKAKLDRAAAREKLERRLKRNYYWIYREWAYKDVKPRIIAEKYMTDESGVELKDYKIFNFHGEPKLIQVDYGRFVDHRRNLYTPDWQYVSAKMNYPTDPSHEIPRPERLDEMLRLAKVLSGGGEIPQVRTDFYSINDKIYFGELTFYHEGGFSTFEPESFGLEMGSWLKLPAKAPS